jgi:hypothetical protein
MIGTSKTYPDIHLLRQQMCTGQLLRPFLRSYLCTLLHVQCAVGLYSLPVKHCSSKPGCVLQTSSTHPLAASTLSTDSPTQMCSAAHDCCDAQHHKMAPGPGPSP